VKLSSLRSLRSQKTEKRRKEEKKTRLASFAHPFSAAFSLFLCSLQTIYLLPIARLRSGC